MLRMQTGFCHHESRRVPLNHRIKIQAFASPVRMVYLLVYSIRQILYKNCALHFLWVLVWPLLTDAIASKAPAKITGSWLEGRRGVQAWGWQTGGAVAEQWQRLERGGCRASKALGSPALIG